MEALTPTKNRFMVVDVARGIAILLMIVYHFSWDLTFFKLADFRIFSNPYWIWFSTFIAGLILLVMGVSQVMARRRGFNSKIFLKRLVVISTCAVAVSVGTYMIDPNTFVFFGILHLIAVASILLTAVISLPSPFLVLISTLLLTGPLFLTHVAFSPAWLAWTGLWPLSSTSVDYFPLFPWLAVPLLGIVIGRWLLAMDEQHQFLNWQSNNPMLRIVYVAGRYSLLIYMIHQPILFGSLYAVSSLMNF